MAGIGISTRAVRTIGVLCGIGVSIFTVVSLPLALFHGAWDWGGLKLGGHLPWFAMPSILSSWETSWWFSWRGMSIPPAPGWLWVLKQTFLLLMPILALLLTFHIFIPMSRRIKQVSGIRPRPSGDGSRMQEFINDLSDATNGPKAKVWVVPLGGIQAFALSGPVYGHGIVVHLGVIQSLPPAIVDWILAHEYGHIKNGDTRSATLWILAMRSIAIFDTARHALANTMIRVLIEIPLLRLLTFPISILFRLLSTAGKIGRRTGSLVFKLFDSWASRRMEFAADRYAALTVGSEPGIVFFESVMGEWEPRFNGLFATHPKMADRVKELRKLHTKEKASV